MQLELKIEWLVNDVVAVWNVRQALAVIVVQTVIVYSPEEGPLYLRMVECS